MELKIHEHPQKDSYASASEWPGPFSAQVHWMFREQMAHTHIDVGFPLYAELSSPVECPFTITTFMHPGRVGAINVGNYKTSDANESVKFDGGAGLDFAGDPMGVKTWTGKFTFAPGVGDPVNAPRHGWGAMNFQVHASFPDGRDTTITLVLPFWSMVDPSAPLAGGIAKPLIMAIATISPLTGNDVQSYGLQTVQFDDIIPIAPISVPWLVTGSAYGYGQRSMPPALVEERLDLDLHHGIAGGELLRMPAEESLVHVGMPFVPAQLGTGLHKLAIMRTQSNGTDETSAALLVVKATVDPNAPIPVPIPVPQPDPMPTPTPTPTPTPDPTPQPQPGNVTLGTIERRPDGRICVCGPKGATVEMNADGTPCLVLELK